MPAVAIMVSPLRQASIARCIVRYGEARLPSPLTSSPLGATNISSAEQRRRWWMMGSSTRSNARGVGGGIADLGERDREGGRGGGGG